MSISDEEYYRRKEEQIEKYGENWQMKIPKPTTPAEISERNADFKEMTKFEFILKWGYNFPFEIGNCKLEDYDFDNPNMTIEEALRIGREKYPLDK